MPASRLPPSASPRTRRCPSRSISRRRFSSPLGMKAVLRGSPAAGLHGTLERPRRSSRASCSTPTLIAPGDLRRGDERPVPGLAGVIPDLGRFDPNDWGLGFELKGSKQPHFSGTLTSPRTFGHWGGSGTFVWVDPDRELALGVLTDLDFGDWAKEAWPRLSDAVRATSKRKEAANSGQTACTDAISRACSFEERPMAVIERKRITSEQEPERAVFVAADGRRARLVRAARHSRPRSSPCLWLIGLGVGMLGFGSLPGVSAREGTVRQDRRWPRCTARRAIGRGSPRLHRERRPTVEARRVATPTRTRSVRVPAASEGATRRLAPHASPHASPRAGNDSAAGRRADAVNPAARQRGWARRRQHRTAGPDEAGLPPPPPGTRGERRGQEPPTTPPPVPPGQVKKAQEPPPPPAAARKGLNPVTRRSRRAISRWLVLALLLVTLAVLLGAQGLSTQNDGPERDAGGRRRRAPGRRGVDPHLER